MFVCWMSKFVGLFFVKQSKFANLPITLPLKNFFFRRCVLQIAYPFFSLTPLAIKMMRETCWHGGRRVRPYRDWMT